MVYNLLRKEVCMELTLRKDVPVSETWDLSLLYTSEKEYEQDVLTLKELAKTLDSSDVNDEKKLLSTLKNIENYKILEDKLFNYASLARSVDLFDEKNNNRIDKLEMICAKLSNSLLSALNKIKRLDDAKLKKFISNHKEYERFLDKLLLKKEFDLEDDVESALLQISPVFDSQYVMYSKTLMTDITFDSFEVDGITYPNSFVLFENKYQTSKNTEIRRKAFESFSKALLAYKNTIGNNYINQIKKEKILSDMRGYKSIFDYLLIDQEVTREAYDIQLDTIMENLSKPMRKWANLIKKTYNLDKLYFEDLKAPLDPDYTPELSIDLAKDYARSSLEIMGSEYSTVVDKALDNRWIDWAQNEGKSGGGFCASPYKEASFILLSWTSKLSEVFTLVHELGHAVHHYYAANNTNILNYNSSLYFIEAPSTINELIFSNYLSKQSEDKRLKRFAKSSTIENTYYHNFVTHFLEAYYQREVYRAIDKGESIDANFLCKTKKETLETFWGDAVEISDNASLTWMRQPHYYMGLYSYTYSAGLNISTQVANKIFTDNSYAKKWIKVLKKGGSLNPKELAAMVDIDITDPKGLNNTIKYIDKTIDEIIELS